MLKDVCSDVRIEFCKYCFQQHSSPLDWEGWMQSGNTKGGSITELLTSCLTGLDQSDLQIKTKNVSCHTADSQPVKQEVNGTVILPPLVFPDVVVDWNSRQKKRDKSKAITPVQTLLTLKQVSAMEFASFLKIFLRSFLKNGNIIATEILVFYVTF